MHPKVRRRVPVAPSRIRALKELQAELTASAMASTPIAMAASMKLTPPRQPLVALVPAAALEHLPALLAQRSTPATPEVPLRIAPATESMTIAMAASTKHLCPKQLPAEKVYARRQEKRAASPECSSTAAPPKACRIPIVTASMTTAMAASTKRLRI